MKATDLVGKEAIRNVETLYCDKDGSLTLFIQGRPVVYVPKQMRVTDPKVSRPGLAAGPPEFVDTDRMRLQLLCKDEEVPKILDFYDKIQLPHRLVEVSRFESSSYTDLSRLTLKQRQALLTAYSLGYYDVPRENFFRAVGEVPQAGNLYLRRAPKKGRERIAFQRPLAINPTMDSNDRQPVDMAEVTRHLGYSVQQLSSPTSL